MHRSCLQIAFTALLFANAAAAWGADKSSVAYYPVTGKTAAEIYANIKKASPRVARNATFAFTMIATKTDKKNLTKDGVCRYGTFRTSAIYVFNVPQHGKASSMRGTTRAKWDSFVSYLVRHEEGHRSIWRECFAQYDREALQLTAKTCEKLDKTRENLFTAIKRQCLARDEAYDVIFRKEVLREPFVAEALKGDGKDRK